jgi:predicted secreted protein
MVNNSTNINKNHLLHQLIEWCQQFHQYQQKLILVELLTITQWVKVRGGACWYRWNCWPLINELRWKVMFADIGWIVDHHSTKITSHLNSLSDGQQFHQYQQKSPLTSTHWVMSTIPPISTKITSHFNFGRIVDHHSMSLGERWFWLILVELLTITQWVEVRGDFCWYWWNYGQQFHQYQQKSPLTSTHWMMVNNSTNINKNHLFVDHHSMSWS